MTKKKVAPCGHEKDAVDYDEWLEEQLKIENRKIEAEEKVMDMKKLNPKLMNNPTVDNAIFKDSQKIIVNVPLSEIHTVDRGFPEIKREGVFEHGFRCNNCGLHFKLYSWQEFRHNAVNTYCPECGFRGSMMHCVKTLSTEQEFNLFGEGEIYKHCYF